MESDFGKLNINEECYCSGVCSCSSKTVLTSSSEPLNERLHESSDSEDELREACGIMACVLSRDIPKESLNVAHTVCTGLIALQHRGQEGAGIVTSDGKGTTSFRYHKGQGLISTIFTDENLVSLKGSLCLGHTRYCTAGGSDPINTQPFVVHTRHGPIAVAHNGQLINADALRATVLDRGVGLSTRSDSELLTQILALTPPRGEQKGPDWPSRIRHLMEASPTAYSLALMFENKIYGVRDPFGNRPLCIGKLSTVNDDSVNSSVSSTLGWVLSSESCAFQSIGATYYKEVMPGEIVEISPSGVRTLDIVARPRKNTRALSPALCDNHDTEYVYHNGMEDSSPAFCIFEYVYFARPDSIFEGQQVYNVRQRCGKQLAIEASVEADIVSSIPESATPAALGFSIQSGIPFTEVLCKNRYIGRSFLQPDTRSRRLAVSKKFGVLTQNVEGKRLILVDDSIVRGNTVRAIIRLLKDRGAKEVHLRIASPPIKYPCYMGIEIPTKGELIANKKEPDKLAEFVGADSLVYLSIKGLVEAVQSEAKVKSGSVGHCTACLDANYPCKVEW